MAIFGTNLHHGLEDLEARYGPMVLATITGLGMLLGVVITLIITRPAPRPRNLAGSGMAKKYPRGRR